jgi:tripartite ATP-independent transporter DctM subunit
MEWYESLAFCIGLLLVLFATGFPIAFCFILFDIVGMMIYFGGTSALDSLILSMTSSVTSFSLLPIPLFLLLGSLMFHSGVAIKMIETIGKAFGRLPGRLGLVAVACGVLLATMGGSTAASSALLAQTLMPEMRRLGYSKTMTLGPIMGSGVLAAIIPPSGQAVLLASLAQISVSKMLIGGIIPGVAMAACYAAYIVLTCWLRPHHAPSREEQKLPMSATLKNLFLYVFPLAVIFILTVGTIFMGIATPTEAAALGVIGMVVLIGAYKKLSWKMFNTAVVSSVRISSMLLIILLASTAFSQILAFSGAAGGLSNWVSNLPLSPIAIHIAMLLVVLFLGMIMDITSIMMITIPIFTPVVGLTGINPLWWGVTVLICLEIGVISPPFGIILFTMKGLVPKDVGMGDIYKATYPFIACDLVGLALVLTCPFLVLWLPKIVSN